MVPPWLRGALRQLLARRERLPYALLLCGPEGAGKLALAEAFARALLCECPGAEGEACGRCAACGWMEQGAHPDLRRLEPEAETDAGAAEEEGAKRGGTQITIGQVRGLADFINVSSHRGRHKLVLIRPAESLNMNAANALLKSLEEPPPATCFVLLSHRWQQLPPTIRSRCQRIVLPLPRAEEARAWLEEQGVREPELALAQAGGAPLAALRYDEEYWRARRSFLDEIADTELDPLAAAERLQELPPALAVEWMQKWSFDLACCRAAGTVRYNLDCAEALARLAGRLGAQEAIRFHRHVLGLRRIAVHPLNPRLFLEELLLSYAALLRASRAPAA
ncbi:MAG TPA: DNA polymerase III subunit delta' [Burkholderiales bacterium]|nr:DNA polymerase III subunit delta' [Burkholderiales bacterium]